MRRRALLSGFGAFRPPLRAPKLKQENPNDREALCTMKHLGRTWDAWRQSVANAGQTASC